MDRLAERHEALAQTVELLTMDIEKLRASQEADGERIRQITRAIELDAENIRALARIAKNRLSRLEGNGAANGHEIDDDE